MITIIIIAFLAGFIGGYIGKDIENPIVGFLLGFCVWVISVGVITSLSKVDYSSKDIRKDHTVIYNDSLYGKVDSISYHIKGKLIPYNKINKID